MHGKSITTIVCAGFLLGAMAPTLAADNSANDGPNTGANVTASTSNNGDAMVDDKHMSTDEWTATASDTTNDTTNAEATKSQSAQEYNASTDTTASADTAYNAAHAAHAAHAAQQARTGFVVGRLVDKTGHINGYVVRIVDANASDANRYVIVPRQQMKAITDRASENTASNDQPQTADSDTDTDTGSANVGQQQRLIKMMYQQLQKQAVQIGLLRRQLAQQQSGLQTNMTPAQQRNSTGQGPLDQVARIVVDRAGRLQAIVLDSGAILASKNWVRQVQGQAGDASRNTLRNNASGNAYDPGASEQRRQAVIIFNPQP